MSELADSRALPRNKTGKFQKAATAASSVAQMVSKAGGGGDSPTLGLGRDILEAVSADVKLDEDRSPGSTPAAAAATLDVGGGRPDPDPGRTSPPGRTGTAAKDPLGSSLFSMAALMRPSVTASGATKGPGSSAVASVTSSLSPDLGHPGLLPPHPGLSASALLANLNSSLQLGQVFFRFGRLQYTAFFLRELPLMTPTKFLFFFTP